MSRNGRCFEDTKYPPRRGWEVVESDSHDGWMHGGYTTDVLKRCPVCGRRAVFEEDSYAKAPKSERARIFIGFCPTCELRTRTPGTLREAVTQWQTVQYSPDSWLHCHRPKLDSFGVAELCNVVCGTAYEDLRMYVDIMLGNDIRIPRVARTSHKQRATELTEEETYSHSELEVRRIDEFFRTSPLAFALDRDAVMSKLRKELFPDLTPKERLKIPLDPTEMWRGKEIAKKCIAERNSRKQPSAEDMQAEPMFRSTSRRTPKMRIRKMT